MQQLAVWWLYGTLRNFSAPKMFVHTYKVHISARVKAPEKPRNFQRRQDRGPDELLWTSHLVPSIWFHRNQARKKTFLTVDKIMSPRFHNPNSQEIHLSARLSDEKTNANKGTCAADVGEKTAIKHPMTWFNFASPLSGIAITIIACKSRCIILAEATAAGTDRQNAVLVAQRWGSLDL